MDGLLLINKEKNYTSRDIVNIISKVLNTKKVGHTGTLDPLATGVLVVAVGNALKVVDYLTNEKKEYIAVVKLGLETDTLDITGNIIKEDNNYIINEENIKNTLLSFLGKSLQEVPLYSAIRVNGKRLYEYARENIEVELPKREIEIFDIEFVSLEEDCFTFRVLVSKGTYIRSLIRDIGKKLNIPCSMKELKRTKQGIFKLEDSISLKDVENNNYKFIPIIDVLDNFEKIEVDDFLKNKILNGRILDNRYKSDKIVFVDKSNNVLAIYKVYDKDITKIKPIKVFKDI